METLKQIKDKHIEKVYNDCKGNVAEAAKLLQIGKTTVYNWLKKKGIALVIILLVSQLHAQTAKVIQLSEDDAKTAARLAAEEKNIEKARKNFEAHINKVYLANKTKKGWEHGFLFSEDYKFIVWQIISNVCQSNVTYFGESKVVCNPKGACVMIN